MIKKNLKTLMLVGVLAFCQTVLADPPDDPIIVTIPTDSAATIPGSVNFVPFGSNLNGPIVRPFQTNFGIPRAAGSVWDWKPTRSNYFFRTDFSQNPNDDYLCPPKPSDFTQLARQFDTAACYENKKSFTTLVGTEISAEVNKQLILSDESVCACLYQKAETNRILANVLRTDDLNLQVSDVDKQILNYKNGLAEVTKKMAEKSLASSFQASIIFDGNKDATEAYKNNLGQEFLGAVENANAGRAPGSAGGGVVGGLIGGIFDWKNLSRQKDASEGISGIERTVGVGKVNRAKFEEGIKRVNEEFKVPDPNPAILSEAAYASGQCIGGREFLAFNQLPDGDEIFQELDVANFQENDWDYNILKNQYKGYMVLSGDFKSLPGNAMAIKRIKAKMNFLNKNPMIKSFLAAQDNYKDYFARKKPDSTYQETINSYLNGGKLQRNKQKLFDIMKKMAKDNICSRPGQKSTDCLKKSLNDGRLQTYKKDLQDLFKKPEVAEIAKIESKYDLFRDLDQFKLDRTVDPKSLPLTQEAVYTNFVKETGLDPDKCLDGNLDGTSEKLSECSQIYASYCKRVRSVVPRLAETEDSALADNIDSAMAHDFNPDIEKNPHLREFNANICNQPKRKNPQDLNEKPATFFSYKTEYCAANRSKPECSGDSNENIAIIRAKFMDEYRLSFTEEELNFNLAMKIDKVESINKADAHSIATQTNGTGSATGSSGSSSSDTIADWTKVNQSFPGSSNTASNSNSGLGNDALPEAEAKAVPFSGLARGLSSLSNAMGSTDAVSDEPQMNYSNASMGGAQASTQNLEVPKVENMEKPEREELLEDWKKEMEEWKAKKNSPDAAQSALASANEASMKAKIEALEQLLANQKQLTADQYKLINDSIAAQTRIQDRTIASQDESEEGPRTTNRRRSSNGIVGSNTDVDDETNRTPGNVPEQMNTSGSGNGGGAAASSRSRSSNSNAISDNSRDSVAREEAKLVNLRENSNGSITITSTAGNTGATSANAIVVPVSDAIYLSATSPAGLNLSQIEASIPKDQIAKLQDKGEYFILLLQNGSNPPLEVKVKKEKNGLVQVDGAPIVSRNVSLEGLLNTLPTTR